MKVLDFKEQSWKAQNQKQTQALQCTNYCSSQPSETKN